MTEAQQATAEYAAIEELAGVFLASSLKLREARSQFEGFASMLQSGTEAGERGIAFGAKIQNKLCPTISQLESEYEDLHKDLVNAMNEMKQAN